MDVAHSVFFILETKHHGTSLTAPFNLSNGYYGTVVFFSAKANSKKVLQVLNVLSTK